jgi:hypothetical protein
VLAWDDRTRLEDERLNLAGHSVAVVQRSSVDQ